MSLTCGVADAEDTSGTPPTEEGSAEGEGADTPYLSSIEDLIVVDFAPFSFILPVCNEWCDTLTLIPIFDSDAQPWNGSITLHFTSDVEGRVWKGKGREGEGREEVGLMESDPNCRVGGDVVVKLSIVLANLLQRFDPFIIWVLEQSSIIFSLLFSAIFLQYCYN